MLDLFSPLSPEARAENRRAYRSFLADRDGEVDPEGRTLSRREELMERHLRPLANPRPIDRALFDKQYRSFDRRVETPDEMLLLLSTVKLNAAEAYGVGRTFDKTYERAVRENDDVELILQIEEGYHTRILLSSAVLYGMNVSVPFSPSAALRALITGIADMPEVLARPLLLASEILGTVVFLNLLFLARRVLKDDPELRDAYEERIIEILIDELGHVSFNRMCLGSRGLARARFLLPFVSHGLKNSIAEYGTLCRQLGVELVLNPDTVVGPRSALPEAVKRSAFLA
jgi:hypothetical protein